MRSGVGDPHPDRAGVGDRAFQHAAAWIRDRQERIHHPGSERTKPAVDEHRFDGVMVPTGHQDDAGVLARPAERILQRPQDADRMISRGGVRLPGLVVAAPGEA